MDEIDAQLLRLLQADGRLGAAQLAQQVGLAPSTVHERLTRLRREEFILGFEAVLDPAHFADSMLVFAEVRLSGQGPAYEQALAAAVQRCDEIIECHRLGDQGTYLVKARVPDMAAHRRLFGDVLWAIPGVRDVRSYNAIDEVKPDAGLPL